MRVCPGIHWQRYVQRRARHGRVVDPKLEARHAASGGYPELEFRQSSFEFRRAFVRDLLAIGLLCTARSICGFLKERQALAVFPACS
ncbi:MAG: hypothetical protein WDO69_25645 [Pseudomonadota bacterium]